jgi:hypothetical protein
VLERRGGPFIAPEGNLATGVAETRTCSGQGPDMFGQPLWNSAWGPASFHSLEPLWNLARRPDISGLTGVFEIYELEKRLFTHASQQATKVNYSHE